MRVGTFQRRGESLAQRLLADGVKNSQVLSIIANTPRHLFVKEVFSHKAYENTALPIDQGQTISQPYIVARMTALMLEALQKQGRKPSKVLEIGTGSGYQTAILAQLCDHVFSVERIKSLQFQAKRRLQQIDLHNVSMKHGDGWKGWKTKAPFDAIIVTAAPTSVPEALLAQLDEGGVLVLPVGKSQQVLQVMVKANGRLSSREIENVNFVPLVEGEIV